MHLLLQKNISLLFNKVLHFTPKMRNQYSLRAQKPRKVEVPATWIGGFGYV